MKANDSSCVLVILVLMTYMDDDACNSPGGDLRDDVNKDSKDLLSKTWVLMMMMMLMMLMMMLIVMIDDGDDGADDHDEMLMPSRMMMVLVGGRGGGS